MAKTEGWIDTAQEAARAAAQTIKETIEEGSASSVAGSLEDNGEGGPGVIVAGRRSTGRFDVLRALGDTVRRYTGKPLGEWSEDLTAFMRDRPLIGAALMVGVGYIAARLMRR